ncbi:ubiquinol-cytochrome C reductase complex subunit UcrQ [Thermoascus aurantiacus ATCC 26904]
MGGQYPDPKHGIYLGGWGALGCPTPQKGIVTYSLSANRQRPMAGALHAAIFNTWRRFRHQVLYVAPPFIVAYAAMNWAIERNEYLNSKVGRLAEGIEE